MLILSSVMLADVERRLEDAYSRTGKNFVFSAQTMQLSSTWTAATVATDDEMLVRLINSDILVLLR